MQRVATQFQQFMVGVHRTIGQHGVTSLGSNGAQSVDR
jgi:hypothetical protein